MTTKEQIIQLARQNGEVLYCEDFKCFGDCPSCCPSCHYNNEEVDYEMCSLDISIGDGKEVQAFVCCEIWGWLRKIFKNETRTTR